jgi:hypothetical protein
VKGDLNIPVFDITPIKIEIWKSIPKSQEEIEVNISIPELSLTKGAGKVDLKVETPKIDKYQKSKVN